MGSSTTPLNSTFIGGVLFILVVVWVLWQQLAATPHKPLNPTVTLNNGQRMPMLGLGTWMSKNGSGDAVRHALKVGYRHIDTAYIYMNEAGIGEELSKIGELGLRREDLFITTKLWIQEMDPGDVRPALQRSLRDLQFTYVDLYLVHWPVAVRKGADMQHLHRSDFLDIPLLDTWRAMEALVDDSLAKAIGVSNFGVHHLEPLLRSARIRPVVNQVELHPLLAQPELLSYCKSQGIILTAYAPLGSPGRPPWQVVHNDVAEVLTHPVVAEIAKKYARTPAQVLIRWAIDRGTVVIPKSAKPHRIEENFECLMFQLAAADVHRLSSLNSNTRVLQGRKFWEPRGLSYEDFWGHSS
jgi:diketogulonate reductase-like aldo/keto reductase